MTHPVLDLETSDLRLRRESRVANVLHLYDLARVYGRERLGGDVIREMADVADAIKTQKALMGLRALEAQAREAKAGEGQPSREVG
jgi:hypothetical protein